MESDVSVITPEGIEPKLGCVGGFPERILLELDDGRITPCSSSLGYFLIHVSYHSLSSTLDGQDMMSVPRAKAELLWLR